MSIILGMTRVAGGKLRLILGKHRLRMCFGGKSGGKGRLSVGWLSVFIRMMWGLRRGIGHCRCIGDVGTLIKKWLILNVEYL